MVSSLSHCNDLGRPTTTMVVTNGHKKTPLNVVMSYGMIVPLSEALDMSGSFHLTIGYLLKDKHKRLRVIVPWSVG